MVLSSHIEKHIESCFKVGVLAKIGFIDAANLIYKIHTLNLNELRTRTEANIASMERTMSLISRNHTEGDCDVDRSTMHRAAGIHNAKSVHIQLRDILCQILPVLIYHQTISIVQRYLITAPTPVAATEHVNSLFDYLIRIECLSVNLSILILSELLVGLNRLITGALNVVTRESVLVDKTSLRRDLIELDFVPTALAHKTLKDIDAFTKTRKTDTILTRAKTESLTSLGAKGTRLLAGSVLRLEPLAEQRRSTRIYVEHKLVAHKAPHILFQSGPYKHIEIIPTAKLRNVSKITTHSLCFIICGPLNAHTEETALSLSLQNITKIKEALHSISRIFLKCLHKKEDTILVATLTICTTKGKQIVKRIAGRLMRQAAVFGQLVVKLVFESIYIFHFYFSFLLQNDLSLSR